MIVEIIRAHGKWKVGDTPDVTVNFGNELIALGIAKIHEDQTRRDVQPKKEKEDEPQKIEVHNYFMAPDTTTDAEPEPVKPKRKHKNK